VRQVDIDLTRPVDDFRFWMLTGLERTHVDRESDQVKDESGHDLTIRVTER
jgi:hypothetical protein